MLSRVLKGSGARQVQAMTFATAADAALEPRRLATPVRAAAPPPAGEEVALLLGKVRELEAGLAAAKREAFEAGRMQGEQSARAAAEPVLERMNASIAATLNLRPDLRRRAEKDALGILDPHGAPAVCRIDPGCASGWESEQSSG